MHWASKAALPAFSISVGKLVGHSYTSIRAWRRRRRLGNGKMLFAQHARIVKWPIAIGRRAPNVRCAPTSELTWTLSTIDLFAKIDREI